MPRNTNQIPSDVPHVCLLHDEDGDAWKVLEERAKLELSEDEDTRRRALGLLRSKLKEEPGLRWQDDDFFLLAFLRAKKFQIKRALHLVKGFYSTIGRYADIFYDLTQEGVTKTMKQNFMDFLPERNRDGCTVTVFRMNTWDPQVISSDDILAADVVGFLHALCNRSMQVTGVRIVIDFEGFNFNQFLHISTKHMRLFGEILQNSVPMRMRGLHIVNESRLFHYLWIMVQRFFSKKLKERVHFHGNDLKSLHKFIDPSILPAEYGGEQPTYDNFSWRKKIEASSDYINYVFSFGYEKYLKTRKTAFIEREQMKIITENIRI